MDNIPAPTLLRLKQNQYVCSAPFLSLNFDTNGNMTVCCFNRTAVLGTYPAQSIMQAWCSDAMQELRDNLQNLNFRKAGCELCYKQLAINNYNNSLIEKFNRYNIARVFTSMLPTVLEFEISNVCNYECIMCGGKWSSSIRKNREKLPPLISPYDEDFVKQLNPILPNLHFANFLGGEPFAISLYYKIWDQIFEKSKHAVISITTNGSIMTDKVRNIISHSNVNIVCSIDSLIPETYNFIRKNGQFEIVMKNIREFIDYKALKSITFSPLIQNWREIPNILQFCTENKLGIYFNTVYGPLGGKIPSIHKNSELLPDVSLYDLSLEERLHICNFLNTECAKYTDYMYHINGLIKSLENYRGASDRNVLL
jgi:MoaA/NifB/PqqE/SkfB family radical SAM enzyme